MKPTVTVEDMKREAEYPGGQDTPDYKRLHVGKTVIRLSRFEAEKIANELSDGAVPRSGATE